LTIAQPLAPMPVGWGLSHSSKEDNNGTTAARVGGGGET